jgi:hypothetical protein
MAGLFVFVVITDPIFVGEKHQQRRKGGLLTRFLCVTRFSGERRELIYLYGTRGAQCH